MKSEYWNELGRSVFYNDYAFILYEGEGTNYHPGPHFSIKYIFKNGKTSFCSSGYKNLAEAMLSFNLLSSMHYARLNGLPYRHILENRSPTEEESKYIGYSSLNSI